METEEEKPFTCDRCQFETKFPSNLKRHILRVHEGNSTGKLKNFIYKCQEGEGCKYETTRKRNLSRHIESRHRRKKRLSKCKYCDFATTSLPVFIRHEKSHTGQAIARHSCSICKVSYGNEMDFRKHLDTVHKVQSQFSIVEHAFSKKLRIYSRHIRKKASDSACLWDIFEEFKSLCKRIIAEDFPIFRFNLTLFGIFSKIISPMEHPESEIFVLKSTHFIIKPHTKLKSIFSTIIKNLDERLENILLRGCK